MPHKEVILPDFLIVGAAKCGTSSLYQYLIQHPEVFMSAVKEPRFISSQFTPFPLKGPGDDRVEAWYVKTFAEYVKLFENARRYKAIGEASADNLYFYEKAIPVIKEVLGNPKIIIILRDPVKRAFSAYQHLKRDKREFLSFQEALQKEQERIEDNWEFIYHYTETGKYYQQVKAYLENFDQVKIVLNEDLSAHPQQVMKEIFKFLEVNPSFIINSSLRHNISGIPRSRWLHHILSSENAVRKTLRPAARLILRKKSREAIFHRLNSLNLRRQPRASAEYINLKKIFAEDINKLSKLIKRDLDVWKGV